MVDCLFAVVSISHSSGEQALKVRLRFAAFRRETVIVPVCASQHLYCAVQDEIAELVQQRDLLKRECADLMIELECIAEEAQLARRLLLDGGHSEGDRDTTDDAIVDTLVVGTGNQADADAVVVGGGDGGEGIVTVPAASPAVSRTHSARFAERYDALERKDSERSVAAGSNAHAQFAIPKTVSANGL